MCSSVDMQSDIVRFKQEASKSTNHTQSPQGSERPWTQRIIKGHQTPSLEDFRIVIDDILDTRAALLSY